MTFDHIYSNPPFGKIGVDIVNKITKEILYNDISILGTAAMLSKHNDVLALEYVYIENYNKASEDNFRGWVLHHRFEDKGFSMQELKEKGLYYRRPAKELIYMTKEEHDEHHNKNKRRDCQCIETGEVHYVNEWRRLGFPLAGDVANGKYVSHHNLHFVWA